MRKKIIIISSGLLVVIIAIIVSFGNKEPRETPIIQKTDTDEVTFPNAETIPGATTQNTTAKDGELENGTTTQRGRVAIIKRLSSTPIVNYTTIGREGVNMVTRWVERGTGHIYDYNHKDSKQIRVSNITIPSIMEAYWGNLGQNLLFRYIDDRGVIKSYVRKLPANTSKEEQTAGDINLTELNGFYLPDNAKAIALAPRGSEKTECVVFMKQTISETGINNPEEVKHLQEFLRNIEKLDVGVDGKYGTSTQVAVMIFQTRYFDEILAPLGLKEPTTHVGKATRDQINKIYCEVTGGEVTGGKFVYQLDTGAGSNIYLSDFSDTGKTILSTSLQQYYISWNSENFLTLTTAPSSKVEGFSFNVKTKSAGMTDKDLDPTLVFKKGLTLLSSPDNKYYIYTEVKDKMLLTSLFNKEGGVIQPFPINTLPVEKCVWSKIDSKIVYCGAPLYGFSDKQPEAWYQGLVPSEDNIYRINIETGELELLASPTELNVGLLDIVDIQLSDKENYIFFRDKGTSYVWSLYLPNENAPLI